jgi:hypothetical protein
MRQVGMQLLAKVLDELPDRVPHVRHKGITGILHV